MVKKKVVKKAAKKKAPSRKKAASSKKAVAKSAASKKKVSKKKTSKATSKKPTSKKSTPEPISETVEVDDGFHWQPADKGYSLALQGTKLFARNKAGKKLASVPAALKKTELAEQLISLRDWLVQHRQECLDSVETWMLRSLPVPRDALSSVWPDDAWRDVLENLVVAPTTKDGFDQDLAGFLRGVDAKKGIGIVDLDGETQWLKTQTIAIPHPILLTELTDFRELATELDLKQQSDQLFRETWLRKDIDEDTTHSISQFARGKFEMLSHANGAAKRFGYRVSGGSAVCSVWEQGVAVEARYWIGADDPSYETWTGDLTFVDNREKGLELDNVGPVALSEGMRMASAVYSKRFIEKENQES